MKLQEYKQNKGAEAAGKVKNLWTLLSFALQYKSKEILLALLIIAISWPELINKIKSFILNLFK